MSPVFGRVIYRLEVATSTQDVLKELYLSRQAKPGAIVVAVEQLHGRGRRDRSWDSLAGKGLWTSILVQPGGPEEQWTWTPLWAGIAVQRALADLLSNHRSMDPDLIRLKWPNDLMIGNAKLGGILTERVQIGSRQAVILGIGINLLHRWDDFPPHLKEKAVSLFLATGQGYSPDALLEKLINQVEMLYPLLNPVNPGLIGEIWLNHAWGLESIVNLTSGGKQAEGTFTGLGDHGEIRLKIKGGGVIEFANAENIEPLG